MPEPNRLTGQAEPNKLAGPERAPNRPRSDSPGGPGRGSAMSPLLRVLATLAFFAFLVVGTMLGSGSTSEQAPGARAPATFEPGGVIVPEENEPGDLGITTLWDLAPGQCFDHGSFDERVVSCEAPHDAELIAQLSHRAPTGEPFPGGVEVARYAEAACADAFLRYVGIPPDDSVLPIAYAYPSEESWADYDDRSIVCTVDSEPTGEKLVGSVRDSAR